MAKEPLTIKVDPASELARVLDEADERPVVLDSHGVRYTVNRDLGDLWAGYSPQKAREALAKSAGAFTGMDTAALKRELREQRAQDSRGRPA